MASCLSTMCNVQYFSDGATESGLICVMCNVMERLEVDGDVDIMAAVRQLQIRRPQCIPSEVTPLCHYVYNYMGFALVCILNIVDSDQRWVVDVVRPNDSSYTNGITRKAVVASTVGSFMRVFLHVIEGA